MAKRVLAITSNDNVAVALTQLEKGEIICLADGKALRVGETIPFGHKLALGFIGQSQEVIKYGQTIGLATADIAEGCHVHVHNVESQRGRGDPGES